MAARIASGAVALALAAAQSQSIGQWETVAVNPQSASLGPYGIFSHKPAVTAGCYIAAGLDVTAANPNTTASYAPSASDARRSVCLLPA